MILESFTWYTKAEFLKPIWFWGQKYYTVSTELNFPVGLPEEFNVTGAVFADVGSLWDADSKASTSMRERKYWQPQEISWEAESLALLSWGKTLWYAIFLYLHKAASRIVE